MPPSETIPLRLDHASLAVRSLSEAISSLDRLLGLSFTVSPEAPDQHGRILLNRSYVEVSAALDSEAWHVPHFFLGFQDPQALRHHLQRAGVDFKWGQYVGVDGTWDDVEIHAGNVPLPILVRRTAPPKLAADWPPALSEPPRSGVHALVAVHLSVPDSDRRKPHMPVCWDGGNVRWSSAKAVESASQVWYSAPGPRNLAVRWEPH